MRIIKPDGTIENREPPNPNRQWSPTEILALEMPPEHPPSDPRSLPHHQTSDQIKKNRAKRAKAARQAKKRKL